jgi:hypothetical protein
MSFDAGSPSGRLAVAQQLHAGHATSIQDEIDEFFVLF